MTKNKLVAGPRSQHTITRIYEVLVDAPMRTRTLAQTIHMDPRHVRRVLGLLQARGEAHIARWGRDEGNNYPVAEWGLGDKPDAKKPRVSSATKARRYRAKLKRERPDEYLRRLKKQRAARLRPQRDIAASWIVPITTPTPDTEEALA